MIRRPPRSTLDRSAAASDVYKRQVQKLVAEIEQYVLAHLTCTGAVDAPGLVQKLKAGDIAGVLAVLPSCTWEAGFDWSLGFDDALGKVIAAAKETLADYHVCNNDACLLYTSPSPRDRTRSRMPSSA